MTREEARQILEDYVKACREDDFFKIETGFTYEEVIEAMDMGAKSLLSHPIPSNLDEAADAHIRRVADAAGHPGWDWTAQDIAEAFIAGAEWMTQQEQPEVDLEKELNQWRHKHFKGKRDGDYSGEYLKRENQLDLARHFAEWGRKQVLQEIYEGKVKPVDKITAAWLNDEQNT